jgi:hypothetical protein
MKYMEKLLEQLSIRGGAIVCTSSLDSEEINQAMASDRMWVEPNTSIGYVYLPNWVGFPTTEEQVEQFEKDYPLSVDMPEGLMNPDFILLSNEKIVEHTVSYIKNALCMMSIDEISHHDVLNFLRKKKH